MRVFFYLSFFSYYSAGAITANGGVMYYGYPLKSTDNKRTGKGRAIAGVMMKC